MAKKQDRAVVAASTTETTPLISKDVEPQPKEPSWKPIHAILLCGFFVSLSFGVTQVPLVYVFRLMTCEAYYETHSQAPHGSDRCSIPEIEAGTARAFSLLSASTTFFGVANLFVTGKCIKRFGVKAALAVQVFWPAARLGVQNVGVMIGGSKGIVVVQLSQVITIIGGPVGYLLALNLYVTEVTQNKERTGYLGILQGCNMFGSAVGFLIGGILADVFSIITPFQVTLGLFLASTVYVLLFLPWIAPPKQENVSTKGHSLISRAFGPLKSIMPAKWVLEDGRIRREYGPLILAAGVFLAVLATSFLPGMLQMYATNIFGFGTKRNSYLVSSHSFLRGMFLTLAFPKIITFGRHWMEKRGNLKQPQSTAEETARLEAAALEGQVEQAIQDEAEPSVPPPKLTDEQETYEFDLLYTRFSTLADGILTLGACFVQSGWQMFLLGALLPLGAGTSSAAKGTILQMCPAGERTDALSAISLVEMIARLTTSFVFGLLFAVFAALGKTYLVFACNAGVALLGFGILLACRFPPKGSRRLVGGSSEERGQGEGGRAVV